MFRIAFYSHDTFGLGHLRRCLKLAASIQGAVERVEGLIVTGSPWTHLFACPSGFGFVYLPPVAKQGRRYRPRASSCDLDKVLSFRRCYLERVLESYRPDLMVVDNVPCGLLGEVLPALRKLKSRRGTRCVLALRDVLDRAEVVRSEWSAVGAAEALETLYDEVWVFGDQKAVGRMAGLPGMSKVPAVACGRLGLDRSAVETRRRQPGSGPIRLSRSVPEILVAGGGGGDAELLVRNYVEMLRSIRPSISSRIILGPDFPPHSLQELRANNGFAARLETFVSDLPGAMVQADVVVAMAGYNTICELEAVGRRAVLVPRVWPRQEQLIRALDQNRAGRAQVLLPDSLCPESLWHTIDSALQRPDPPVIRHQGGAVAAHRAAGLLGCERSERGYSTWTD